MVVFSGVNLCLSMLLLMSSVRYYYKVKNVCNWAWLLFLTIAISVGWVIVYAITLFTPEAIHSSFNAEVTNPLFTLTLTLMVANQLIGAKRYANKLS